MDAWNWWLLAASFWIRVWGSFHDGLSERGPVKEPDGSQRRVGWLPWHLVNWMRRDVLIIAIYLVIGARYVMQAATPGLVLRVVISAAALVALALIHRYLHDFLYKKAVENRRKFLWGDERPKWL